MLNVLVVEIVYFKSKKHIEASRHHELRLSINHFYSFLIPRLWNGGILPADRRIC